MENDSFLNSRTHAGGAKGRYASPQQGSTAMLVFMPWLIYAVLVSMFTFLYHEHLTVVWCIAAFGGAVALLLVFSGDANRWNLLFGFLALFAVIAASVSGYCNYDWNMRPYFAATDNRFYNNVLPQEPALSHADAGSIEFAKGARIDTFKVVGFKWGGTVYCVAPIMDTTMTSRAEYWAIGTDCCEQRGNFQCYDAADETARGGIVLATGDEMYRRAVKQAESAYDLVSSSDPMFVQWVADTEKVEKEMYQTGVYMVVALVVVYFVANAVFAFFASVAAKKIQPPRADKIYHGDV